MCCKRTFSTHTGPLPASTLGFWAEFEKQTSHQLPRTKQLPEEASCCQAGLGTNPMYKQFPFCFRKSPEMSLRRPRPQPTMSYTPLASLTCGSTPQIRQPEESPTDTRVQKRWMAGPGSYPETQTSPLAQPGPDRMLLSLVTALDISRRSPRPRLSPHTLYDQGKRLAGGSTSARG